MRWTNKSMNLWAKSTDQTLLSFPLDMISLSPLEFPDPQMAAKKAKKLSSHVTFFKTGRCAGRSLVCFVKSASLSSTVKLLEPVSSSQVKKRGGLGKLFGSNEVMKVYKVGSEDFL